MEFTSASFFSGVGGIDLGLERAGWKTVSFSEIEPYASAVLSERWPGVPNLGDIVRLAAGSCGVCSQQNDSSISEYDQETGSIDGAANVKQATENQRSRSSNGPDEGGEAGRREGSADFSGHEPNNQHAAVGCSIHSESSPEWQRAILWTGGFPCQDLSSAGRRSGFEGTRSVLAFTFLDLVERYRPHFFLLENVPGLLTSNGGKDFGRLLREVGELGYWWAYRVFDGSLFGVPQRRKRVFILAIDSRRYPDPECAGKVLSVGTSCSRNHSEERAAWSKAANRTGRGAELYRCVLATEGRATGYHRDREFWFERRGQSELAGSTTDSGGVREADGLAGRLDDFKELEDAQDINGKEVAATLRGFGHGWQGQHMSTNSVALSFVKSKRPMSSSDDETWTHSEISPTMNAFDVGDTRTTVAIVESHSDKNAESDLLPLGLDTARYKTIGNGVISPVAEWIGRRLISWMNSQNVAENK